MTSENPYINKYYQIGAESLLSEMHSATVSMNEKHAQIFYHPNNDLIERSGTAATGGLQDIRYRKKHN